MKNLIKKFNLYGKITEQHAKDIEEILENYDKNEKDRIKEKVKDWRRGFSMTCAESDIYEKAHQQILKVLKDI